MKHKRKYNKFILNWNFNDKKALGKAIRLVDKWIFTHAGTGTTKSFRIRDMICEVDSDFYDALSRGDKCRIGRAMSILYNNSRFPALTRGKKKGSTNTYYL
jgi:hypothetical protein